MLSTFLLARGCVFLEGVGRMTVGEYEPDTPRANHTYTAGWFLKRLVIGTLILVFSFGGLAWLTYAAIDPSAGEVESLIDAIGRLTSNF